VSASVERPAGDLSGTVLVTWPDLDRSPGGPADVLTDAGLVLRLAPKLGARSPAELSALLGDDAVGAIASTDPFTAEVLRAHPALRVIARVGVGVDSIDVPVATELGVCVATTPGANEATVADHALAMMLAVLRRVPEHDAGVRRGEWNRTGAHTPRLLHGATVGIVGFGHIGRLVAERLAGFGTTVLAHDPAVSTAVGVRLVGLDELLRTSDVVTVHVPLVPATRQLIGAAQLAMMRPGAVLVNTARGPVVDEAALLAALGSGTIGGAALDVFDVEPPPSASPLFDLPNVILSPHIGGLSTASVAEMTMRCAHAVVAVLRGQEPDHLANPDVRRSPLP
jgi:phosphoglycerate dehydrogenase-like enzyme